jgi:hypothetical protein
MGRRDSLHASAEYRGIGKSRDDRTWHPTDGAPHNFAAVNDENISLAPVRLGIPELVIFELAARTLD